MNHFVVARELHDDNWMDIFCQCQVHRLLFHLILVKYQAEVALF